MRFVIATIFPDMFEPFLSHGIVGRAIDGGIVSAGCVNIRDFATDKHQMTDDRLYGGGCGMVMKPEPLAGAVRAAAAMAPGAARVLLSPQGRVLDQRLAGNQGSIYSEAMRQTATQQRRRHLQQVLEREALRDQGTVPA